MSVCGLALLAKWRRVGLRPSGIGVGITCDNALWCVLQFPTRKLAQPQILQRPLCLT